MHLNLRISAQIRRTPTSFPLAFILAFTWSLTLSGGIAAQEAKIYVPKISEEQATQSALQVLPGKVTDVTVERKRGKDLYVVEIVADKDGAETDVLVDMESGKVLGIDRSSCAGTLPNGRSTMNGRLTGRMASMLLMTGGAGGEV
jgi:hypothetical protein